MSRARQTLGKIGEDLACRELERRGYAIVARRYRRRGGELDIIARDGATLVFVEVKARDGRRFGGAAEAVTGLKRRRMAQLALDYLARHRLTECPCRFDVVSIQLRGPAARRSRCSRMRSTSRDELSLSAAVSDFRLETSDVAQCLSFAKIPSPAAGSSSRPSRRKRPTDFRIERSTLIGGEYCPFCAGREELTPPEVLAFRQNGGAPNGPGWDLRVVPNKFPALQVEGTLDREGEGLFDRMNGIGAHEVIIETPDHGKTLATMSEPEIERVLWAFRERVLDLKKDRPVPLHPALQEPRRRGGRDARALALAADRAADRARLRARGGRRREAALRGEGAVRVLRHHPAGDGGRAARHPRERRHRRARAVRAAVSVRDVAAAAEPWRAVRGGAAAASTRAWRGCSSRCCCGWTARSSRRRTT